MSSMAERVARRWLDRVEDREWIASLPKGLHLYRKYNILLTTDEILLEGLPRDWTLDRTRTEGIKDRRSRGKSVTIAILAVKNALDEEETLDLARRYPGKMMVSLKPGSRVFVEAYYDRGEMHRVKAWGKIG